MPVPIPISDFDLLDDDQKLLLMNQTLTSVCEDLGTLTKTAATKEDVKAAVAEALKSQQKDLDERYVTKERFITVERAVFGAIGLVVIAVIGAVLALVIR